MKRLILPVAVALAAFAVQASAQTVVHDEATGDTYVVGGKTYPRVKEVWVAPEGWTQRVYVVGDEVPSVLRLPKYVILSPHHYGLPNPQGDEKWLRVGPDALLVQVGTGKVLTRVENVFY
jgi:Ni/Co efflux regulator RcnB